MKKILVIGTGGTIASKQMGEGLSPALSAPEILTYVPEVEKLCEIDVLQICNIDSTNITPKIWVDIAGTIKKIYDFYDGFVILHGTDTMAYTSAALSYMIQNSRKPIVITGAQKPINIDGTDAKVNLRDSILYACDDYSQNIVLVFDGNVIAGTRAKKMMARSFNAFHSVNFPILARIQEKHIIRYIPYIPMRERVRFFLDLNDSVCVLKVIPGMREGMLEYLFENYDCIVIESFGVGGIPDNVLEKFYAEMEKWQKMGKFIVMATQVVNEGSNMEIYQVGQKVKKDFNLIEAYDMTLEATVTKMMVLLKRYTSYSDLRRAFYTEINYDILCAFETI
ncbi:L-asparaginase, type I [Lachnospiraceae bacterium oral taxon 082 str. F0431]|nr:L-asparaginase, type I [Lachnospiraceae bacterium oral taxon 082 str. F0431]